MCANYKLTDYNKNNFKKKYPKRILAYKTKIELAVLSAMANIIARKIE